MRVSLPGADLAAPHRRVGEKFLYGFKAGLTARRAAGLVRRAPCRFAPGARRPGGGLKRSGAAARLTRRRQLRTADDDQDQDDGQDHNEDGAKLPGQPAGGVLPPAARGAAPGPRHSGQGDPGHHGARPVVHRRQPDRPRPGKVERPTGRTTLPGRGRPGRGKPARRADPAPHPRLLVLVRRFASWFVVRQAHPAARHTQTIRNADQHVITGHPPAAENL